MRVEKKRRGITNRRSPLLMDQQKAVMLSTPSKSAQRAPLSFTPKVNQCGLLLAPTISVGELNPSPHHRVVVVSRKVAFCFCFFAVQLHKPQPCRLVAEPFATQRYTGEHHLQIHLSVASVLDRRLNTNDQREHQTLPMRLAPAELRHMIHYRV